jgi:hypothetical protein
MPTIRSRSRDTGAVGDEFDFLHRNSLALMSAPDLADGAGSDLLSTTADGSDSNQPPPAAAPMVQVKQRTGELLLTWLEERALTAEERQLVALCTPQLDVVRAGVRSLLRALQSLGERWTRPALGCFAMHMGRRVSDSTMFVMLRVIACCDCQDSCHPHASP